MKKRRSRVARRDYISVRLRPARGSRTKPPSVQQKQKGCLMSKAKHTAAAIGMIGALMASQARAETADSAAEIALLKKQLRLMEEKLDRLQKQTTANTEATADAKAKADDAKAKADNVKADTVRARADSAKAINVANANAAIPIKAPVAPPDAVVHMTN